MKPVHEGKHRMADYLEDCYVCAGPPGIGDLENVHEAELISRLASKFGTEDAELGKRIDELGCFLYEMQDGDYVLIADGDAVHLGDVGDYYYADRYDNEDEASCHRRGVTWLKSFDSSELNGELLSLLHQPLAVSKFGQPVSKERLEHMLTKSRAGMRSSAVPDRLIEQALSVLDEAMQSGDADRRERAAIAILRYAECTVLERR